MIYARIRALSLNDWRGQLWDQEINQPIGEEYRADQRGALIGLMRSWSPLSHMPFIDVDDPVWGT